MVMDGRTPQGIMSGGDPYADPRLAAVYRMLAESPDTAYRGSVLPFRRTTAGTTELAMPGFLMDAARGAVDLMAGVHTGQMSPEATQAMAGFAGSSAMQAPQPGLLAAIKAYHGSPHAFDRFDMSRIGTGEGAQAYGHGLYFAGEPEVAIGYKENLSRNRGAKPTFEVNGVQIRPGHPDYEAADIASWARQFGITDGERIADEIYMKGYDYTPGINEKTQTLLDKDIVKDSRGGGSLYHVTLSPDEDDLLDWDAPLSQQPEKVLHALKKIDAPYGNTGTTVKDVVETIEAAKKDQKLAYLLNKWPFSDKGRDLIKKIGDKERDGGPVASKMLKEAGVPGLRYLDGGSRGNGEGTRNYVMFDDKLVAIDKVER